MVDVTHTILVYLWSVREAGYHDTNFVPLATPPTGPGDDITLCHYTKFELGINVGSLDIS